MFNLFTVFITYYYIYLGLESSLSHSLRVRVISYHFISHMTCHKFRLGSKAMATARHQANKLLSYPSTSSTATLLTASRQQLWSHKLGKPFSCQRTKLTAASSRSSSSSWMPLCGQPMNTLRQKTLTKYRLIWEQPTSLVLFTSNYRRRRWRRFDCHWYIVSRRVSQRGPTCAATFSVLLVWIIWIVCPCGFIR